MLITNKSIISVSVPCDDNTLLVSPDFKCQVMINIWFIWPSQNLQYDDL